MTRITFEGVRCFHDYHACSIRPLTLLVGENSSGKSTFLAICRIAWDMAEGGLSDDVFNEEPFLLGSYDQIASFRGGKAGRAKSFVIGVEADVRLSPRRVEADSFSNTASIQARFVPAGSQSKLSEWVFECGSFKVLAKPSTKKTRLDITITTPKGSQTIEEKVYFRDWLSINRVLADLRFFIFRGLGSSNKADTNNKTPIVSEPDLRNLQAIAHQISQALGPRPFAFAPIRTRPQRTYDPLTDVPKPEGSHIPMVLAKTLFEQSSNSERLQQAMFFFGEQSGLFKSVEIKRKGTKESDPFQIGVRTTGQSFNLVDVGYGVSQVLPIIVETVLSSRGSNFLLQQPEVHLHPRAQAELGSFLASLAISQKKTFVVETHSDYLLDRIRMDVRDKKGLQPNDVSILYFERTQGGVEIHELELDEFGNVANAPPSYRRFFLEEEKRMFGI